MLSKGEFAFVCVSVLLAMPVEAQVRCTMPSGVVIEQALASKCPADAIKGETLDGKPLPGPAKKAPAKIETLGYDIRQKISRDEFGATWPLTVGEGILRCDVADPIRPGITPITFENAGRRYALNGVARGWAERKGWVDARAIWLDDKAIPGTKVVLAPLIERGLQLCKYRAM